MKHSMFAAILAAALIAGCSPSGEAQVASEKATLILATTTSTEDTGLLGELLPAFEKQTGIQVKRVAVGTGQALEMGRRKEADVLLVHAPQKELTFVNNGYGTDRRAVMHNDFVILGPATDPAGLRGKTDVVSAMRSLQEQKTAFVSRGDNSGTHTKEQQLWKKAGVTPTTPWLVETGQGMGASLRIANERQAYILSDRATFLATERLELEVLVEGDPSLYNPYHVLEVTGTKVDRNSVRQLLDFFVAPATQKMIAAYTRDGHKLFTPDAL